MKKINMFWPVYKNLEKEILSLADRIHFTDKQANVYSVYIADLLVRIVIEIEAISKELYLQIGGNPQPIDKSGYKRDLYFDTDCLKMLNDNWNLDKKKVSIVASNFYFSNEENYIIKPLYKSGMRGSSGCKWKQGYQAVKHDRKNSLDKATIINMLNAMAALYILNLYYKEEKIIIGNSYMSTHVFDNRLNSEIFSIFVYEAVVIKRSTDLSLKMDDSCIVNTHGINLDEAVYIIKFDDLSFEIMHQNYNSDWKDYYKEIKESIKLVDFPVGLTPPPKEIVTYEAIINKNTSIYPTQLP